MSALLAMLRIVPAWCYWLLALAGLCGLCEMHGAGRVQKQWDLAIQRQRDADEAALALRREQNRAQAAEQAATSARIQKGHDDEMAKVRADLRNVERLRLGAAWCDGAAPGTTQAGSASGGAAAGAAGRVLSAELDGAVKALIVQAEEAAATARAAQRFIRENGMGDAETATTVTPVAPAPQ